MRQSSAQPAPAMIAQAAKVVVFLVCAWVSAAHMSDYWVIGPTFGLVVLVWRSTDLDTLSKPDAAAFLVASTLIYALVVRLEKGDFKLEGAVAVGTILLPLAHAWLLKAPWKRAGTAILGIYAVWFLLSKMLGQLHDTAGTSQKISEALDEVRLINLASIWQAAYLAFMFWPGLDAVKANRKAAK